MCVKNNCKKYVYMSIRQKASIAYIPWSGHIIWM